MWVAPLDAAGYLDFYERLLATRPVGVLLGRPDGTVLRANAAACRMLGRSEAEICALGRAGLVASPDLDALLAARDADGVANGELLFRHRDGSVFPVTFSSTATTLASGERIALTTIQDLTEQRRVARDLHDNEERLRLFVEHAPAAIAMLDRTMTYIAVSRRWTADYRVERDVIGRCHYDVFPDIPERWRAIHRRCLAGAVERQSEDPFPRADGSIDWVDWEIHPWRHPDGEIGGIVLFSEVVTERRVAHDARRATERRYRDLVDLSPDAVLLNRRGVIEFVNRAAIGLFGARAPEELLGRPVLDLFDPEYHRAVRDRVDRVWAGHGIAPLREKIVRLDGERRDVEVSAAALDDPAGRAIQMVLRDVTEHTRATELLRAAFAATPDAVAIVRMRDRVVLNVNEAFERITGFDAAEVVGRTPVSVGWWGDGAQRDRFLAEVDRPGGVQGFRSSGRRRDGSVFAAEYSAQMFTVAGEQYLLTLIRDVSDRERASDELRLLAAAVEQTPASVVVTDERGTVQFVNPAFERISGFSRREIIGARPSLLKSGKHDAAFYAEMWGTISSGRVWNGRIVNLSKDGRVFTEDAVIAPVRDGAGDIRHYVAVKRDITGELRLQEALHQSQKMESIGRLAGGVAHDFNNLLTVILSCAEDLKDALGDGARLLEDADEIRAAGERARDLTRQLLAFARRQVIAPVALDVAAVIRSSEKLLRRTIGEDIDLVVRSQPELWLARCDPSQLEQVVFNLAVNARDAMPTGGKLVIETSNVTRGDADAALSAARPGDYVQVSVRDTGAGMSAEVMARVFEPFFTTKEPGKGTGLGLATVYGIVKQSAGFIAVDSHPGLGTRFEICLPRATAVAAAPAPAPKATPAARGGGAEKVLLVEDNPLVRDVSTRALRSGGHEVLVASCAAEALRIAEASGSDVRLLVTDVVMPGVSGVELARQLSARLPALRVLLVSGYAERCAEIGAPESNLAFLAKPFTGEALLARVRAVIDTPRAGAA